MPEYKISPDETSFQLKLSDSDKKGVREKIRKDVDAHFNSYASPRKFKFEDSLAETSGDLTISYLERTRFLNTGVNGALAKTIDPNVAPNPKLQRRNIISCRDLKSLSESKIIFSVDFAKQYFYPAFQFDEYHPKSIIADILAIFPKSIKSWDVAKWFYCDNGWLDGKAPQDSLDVPDELRFAAEQFARPGFG